MSTYTAPQRTNRKRSLSHRAKILLSASALIPLSLIAISNVRASAAAKWTTLQDVQDAINTALAPIQSVIASLQQQQNNQQTAITNLQNTQVTHASQISDLQNQQQNQSQQITNLQNSPSRSLKAFDVNNQELGIATTFDGSDSTIYSPTLARFIYLRTRDSLHYEYDGSFLPNNSPQYQSNNCSGTGYSIDDPTTAYNTLFAGPDNFYIVPTAEVATTITPHSEQYFNISSKQYECCPSPTCTFGNPGPAQAYELHQVTLPFSVPLALPLQFKYQ